MIQLDKLRGKLPTLTSAMGQYLSEAAVYCLSQHNHTNGSKLHVLDDLHQDVQLVWTFNLDNRSQYTHCDLQEVTEYGATGIAILLSIEYTEHQTIQRSAKGDGFDYWLGPLMMKIPHHFNKRQD